MSTPEGQHPTPWRSRRLENLLSTLGAWRRRRLERRALRNLRNALGEAGNRLTLDWVLRDRDLASMRTAMADDPTWAALLEQLREAQSEQPLTVRIPPERDGTVVVPDYPWHPLIPTAIWLAVTGALVTLLSRSVNNEVADSFIVAATVGTVVSALFLVSAVGKSRLRRRMRRGGRAPIGTAGAETTTRTSERVPEAPSGPGPPERA